MEYIYIADSNRLCSKMSAFNGIWSVFHVSLLNVKCMDDIFALICLFLFKNNKFLFFLIMLAIE